MKSIIECILAIAFWLIVMLIGGVMESDLSFSDTILWICGLFAALFLDIVALNALCPSEAPAPQTPQSAEYDNK